MGRKYQQRGKADENQHWQKEIIVEGLFKRITEVLQHRWAAELNIGLENPVSTKTVWHKLHESNIHSRASIAKLLITESHAQTRKRWCHDHKTWTSEKSKHSRGMVWWIFLHSVPYIRKSLRLESAQGSAESGIPGCNIDTREVLCWFRQQYRGRVFCWSLHDRITAR
jgi:hypothetical protein